MFQNFLHDLLVQSNREAEVTEEELIVYADTMVRFKPLPNDKISDVIKLKAIADDKLNVAYMMISLLERVRSVHLSLFSWNSF